MKKEPYEIRKEIVELCNLRKEIENKLMQRREMIDACLIEVYLGTKKKKRKKPVYYLSWKEEWQKTKLEYVKVGDLYKVEKRTKQWKEYSELMKKWRKISKDIENEFVELGKLQIRYE